MSDEISELCKKLQQMITTDGRTEEMFLANPFREYYLSESGDGIGREEFLGWSALSLCMHEEYDSGCDPSAIDDTPLNRPDLLSL